MMFILFLMIYIASFNVNGVRGIDRFEKVIQMCNADIICLQETHWDDYKSSECRRKWSGHFFMNNGDEKSCGVAILVKNNIVKDVKVIFNDFKGRVIQVEFSYGDVKYDIINVYAPNNELEKKALFRSLTQKVRENTIIVGDFNVKISRLDVSDTTTFKADMSRATLIEFMNNCNLCDIWRQKNAMKREYSRVQVVLGKLKQSRIDLCLVKTGLINYVYNINYRLNALSDHATLRFGLGETAGGRCGGMWCLNSSLLNRQDYRSMIIKLVQSEVSKALCKNNVIELWEHLKTVIKYKTIKYAKELNFKTNQREKELRLKIIQINGDSNPDIERLVRLQTELEEIDLKRCEGAIVRSRAQYAVEGEKSTAFFLGLEKAKQNKCYFSKLKNKNGVIVDDIVNIANTVQDFYTDLFSKGDSSEVVTEEILSKMDAKISEAEKLVCDQEIVISDIENAVSEMKSNKSPGCDGLTSDFYKSFIVVLAPILLDLFRAMEKEQKVPESMTMGIITLVYKQKGSRDDLGNYRPISLLNTDYKILMKVFANRAKEVLGSIVEPTQAYSVPGREVSDSVRTISDVVDFMKREDEGGIVLSLDFNKAFDRVEHNFMFAVLEKVGFGSRFISWLKLLYKNAKSRVKCNGLLTDAFVLERSVRQGCPLSSILYSIVAEPLAVLLKQDKTIKKIELPGGGFNVVQQFADDTTITVKDMKSVNRVIELVDFYGQASGAKINLSKSEIMFINVTIPRQEEIQFKIKTDYIKVLGTYIGVDSIKARDNLWSEMLSKMQTCLNYWKLRDLKLKGKVTVANSLVLSKLNYVLASIDLPEWALNQINQMITNFIWSSKVSKIARKTLIADYELGGLKLVDVECKKKALRMKVILKYLFDKSDYGWKYLFRYYLNSVMGTGDFTLLMQLKKPMLETLPDFYKEVLLAHAEYLENVDYVCESINVIRELPIFLNKKVRYNDQVLYNKTFIEAGFRQFKDVMYEVIPGFLPPMAMYDTIEVINDAMPKRTIFNYMERIKESIPIQWFRMIQSQHVVYRNVGLPKMRIFHKNKWKCMSVLKTKDMYKWFVSKELQLPASLKFWENIMPDLDLTKVWAKWRIKENSIECEDNDFRIRHNKIFTNVITHQFDREVSRECDICKQKPEDLRHLFVDCVELCVFFEKLKNLLSTCLGFCLNPEDSWSQLILFGLYDISTVKNGNLCKYVLSHARWAIRQRRNIAHYEQRVVMVWYIFKNSMRKDVGHRLIHDSIKFAEVFLKDNTLMSLNENEKLIWHW